MAYLSEPLEKMHRERNAQNPFEVPPTGNEYHFFTHCSTPQLVRLYDNAEEVMHALIELRNKCQDYMSPAVGGVEIDRATAVIRKIMHG